MIKIIYNSPAIPQKPYDFELDKQYDLDKVKDKYIIYRNENRQEFDIGFIKSMFKPCEGYSWDMLEKENKEVKNTSKTKLNNIKQNKNIKNGGV